MKFTGKLRGNFIAIADKSKQTKINTTFFFKITELQNVIIVNANIIDDTNYNKLVESSFTIKNEKNEIQKIDRNIDLPFNEGVQTVSGINPLRLYNIKIENTKKIAKGYYFKWLKGVRLLDSFLALSWNIFIFVPSLFDTKNKFIGGITDELYFGKIEADFVGESTVTNTVVSDSIEINLEDEIISNNEANPNTNLV
jgi:hypothetical protein